MARVNYFRFGNAFKSQANECLLTPDAIRRVEQCSRRLEEFLLRFPPSSSAASSSSALHRKWTLRKKYLLFGETKRIERERMKKIATDGTQEFMVYKTTNNLTFAFEMN